MADLLVGQQVAGCKWSPELGTGRGRAGEGAEVSGSNLQVREQEGEKPETPGPWGSRDFVLRTAGDQEPGAPHPPSASAGD